MGDVSELSFRELGIRFVPRGGRVLVFGPKDEMLRAQLDAEVDRRAALITPALPLVADVPARLIAIVSPAPAREAGHCWSCGDDLRAGRGGQCALCTIALQRALITTGRLAP